MRLRKRGAALLLPLMLAGCGGADGGNDADALEARMDSLEARLNAVEERARSPDFALPKKRGDLEPKAD